MHGRLICGRRERNDIHRGSSHRAAGTSNARDDTMSQLNRAGWCGWVFMVAWVLGGCDQAQEELVTTHLSTVAVAPWDNLKDSLKPNFPTQSNVNEQEDVLRITQQSDEQYLQNLQVHAQGGVGIGTAAMQPTISSSPTAELKQTLSQKDVNFGYNLVDIRRVEAGIQQETAMLNSSLDYVCLRPEKYDAYVVRLQLSVIPSTRTQPYDILADISFFNRNDISWPGDVLPPTDAYCTGLMPIVQPILITDNVEAAQRLYSNHLVQQIALAVAVKGGTAAGQADMKQTIEKLRQLIGIDLNSLYTVARLNDSTIRIRLGANQRVEGGDGYALMPQTHYATLLLLVPRATPPGPPGSVYAVMRAHILSADTGKLQHTKTEADTMAGVVGVMDDYVDSSKGLWAKNLLKDAIHDTTIHHPEILLDMLMALQLNNYDQFFKKWNFLLKKDGVVAAKLRNGLESMPAYWLNEEEVPGITETLLERFRAGAPLIWLELTSKLCSGRFSVAEIPLPAVGPMIYYPQTAFAADDGVHTVVTLGYGWNCNANTVAPLLTATIDDNPKPQTFAAQAISTDSNHCVRMVFPTLWESKGKDSSLSLWAHIPSGLVQFTSLGLRVSSGSESNVFHKVDYKTLKLSMASKEGVRPIRWLGKDAPNPRTVTPDFNVIYRTATQPSGEKTTTQPSADKSKLELVSQTETQVWKKPEATTQKSDGTRPPKDKK